MLVVVCWKVGCGLPGKSRVRMADGKTVRFFCKPHAVKARAYVERSKKRKAYKPAKDVGSATLSIQKSLAAKKRRYLG
ncbi:hypothetical protein LCGC14_0897510 [marine sediment metagenome]|uniref:Uncharacterized protein n=1 Tax=marine sediment metagenome TaxID=412755 RepID=A0A0F9NXE4_9ZZZZ